MNFNCWCFKIIPGNDRIIFILQYWQVCFLFVLTNDNLRPLQLHKFKRLDFLYCFKCAHSFKCTKMHEAFLYSDLNFLKCSKSIFKWCRWPDHLSVRFSRRIIFEIHFRYVLPCKLATTWPNSDCLFLEPETIDFRWRQCHYCFYKKIQVWFTEILSNLKFDGFKANECILKSISRPFFYLR